MENVEVAKRFWKLIGEQDWDSAARLLDPELIVEWPQSRERMRGPDSFIAVNRHYPGNHSVTILRAAAFGPQVVTTVWIEADTGQRTFANSFFEFRQGRIARIEEYWAEPYPAPEWRSRWVESL
jgi:hypothetical protein